MSYPLNRDRNRNRGDTNGGGFGPSINFNFAASNTLDPRVTFSRASNATYVDSTGNLAYAPSNLLTYSEQFDNAAWTKVRASVTANSIAAPNNTLTADTLVEDTTASNTHLAFSSSITASAGTIYTYTIYAKAAGRNWLNIQIGTGTEAYGSLVPFCFFNVTDGSIGTFANCTGIATLVGGGWYRCVLTAIATTVASTTNMRLKLAESSTSDSYTGDGVSGLYLWGAQLNLDGLQPYNSTTVKNLLGYTQEFENAAWTKSNSFIQTNLLTYSEQFDNAAWVKVGMTVTANAETAPNNTVTGDKLVPDVVTGLPYTFQTITVVSGANYAWSVYLKAAGYSWVFLDAFDGANHRTWFDLSTGTIGTVEAGNTATITDVGNGWYRCTIARSSGGVSTAYAVAIVSGNNALNITGNGVSGVFAWGAQLVQGTTPGDYQATTTTTLPVQYRAPDGSLTADKLVETTATGVHYIRQFPNPIGPTCFSVYAKAAERTAVSLDMFDATNGARRVEFNLSTGAIIATLGAGVTSSIVSMGSGWYRCSMVVPSAAAGGDTKVQLYNGGVSWAGDGTSGVYIWGAQLSDSASLDPYVYNFAAAPAAAAYYGPRFYYDPSTLAPLGLLIEEQRTNSIRNNTMQGAVAGTPGTAPTNWTISNPVDGITPQIVGTGTSNGIQYIDVKYTGTSGTAGATTLIGFEQNAQIAALNGQTWTSSAYVAIVGGSTTNIPALVLRTRFNNAAAANLTTTDVSVATATSTLSRFVVTGTATDATTAFVNATIVANFADNSAIDITLRIGLPQLEQGATATSVIPTTTAAATRATDTAVMQGANFSNWYNPVEGTLFVEAANAQAAPALFSTDDGTTSNRVITYFNAANSPAFRVVSGGVDQANFAAGSIAQNATFRLSAAYQLNNFAASLNGAATVTDTSGTVPTVQTTARLGANVSGATIINGYLRRIAYYPRRLSNNELQAITT